jgi:hypothetical protein
LLERHEESAQAIADQIAKMKESTETERARLLAERADVTAPREAAVAQDREEEEASRARIAKLLVHAQREVAHAPMMATML